MQKSINMQENYPFLVAVKPLKSEYEKFNKILITTEEFTIGRSLENNVVITYLAISRKHCAFRMSNENEWWIEDFSSFGIEINNKKLKKGATCKLHSEDIIQLDPTGDFLYKFVMHKDDDFVPRKRVKLEPSSSDILNNVKMKFEESQNFEIKHIEDKINSTKQMLTTSTILKQQLELDMTREMERLQNDFTEQIENLKGEKNEVERQKSLLEEERDAQLATVQKEMESKIKELMDQIEKHNETESELLNENTSLKEKLEKEREEFLAELHRENSSKQDLLEQLEARIKEQEEIRLREKQEMEAVLKKETEQLMLAKENELKNLEEQKKLREQELEKELSKIKSHLAEQMIVTESEKQRLELELETKMEEMAKASEQEKSKVELLLQEREEAERKLSEAQTKSEQSIKELEEHVREREVELAALAAERIQQQAEQSTEVITSLQHQLEIVRAQLESVETEKCSLMDNLCISGFASGSSKQATLHEVGELMESELQCSICAELFVAATTLNCAHTFCKYCITVWKKKKRECPICRAPIVSECKSIVLDSFIEKMVANLTDEMKTKRQSMLKDREELDAGLARQTAAGSRRSSSNGSSADSDLLGWFESEVGEGEDDEGEDYDEHIDPFVDTRTSSRRYRRRGRGYFPSDDSDDTDSSDSGSDSDSADDSASAAPSHISAAESGSALSATGSGSSSAELGSGASAGASDGVRRRRRRYVDGDPDAYYGGYGHCFRCGARGHWAPGCPFR